MSPEKISRMQSLEFLQSEKMRVVHLDLRPEIDPKKIKENDDMIHFLEELTLLIHPDALIAVKQQEALKRHIANLCVQSVDSAQRSRDLLLLASNLNSWK